MDAADTIELAELLELIDDWLESDRDNLATSLARFGGVGSRLTGFRCPFRGVGYDGSENWTQSGSVPGSACAKLRDESPQVPPAGHQAPPVSTKPAEGTSSVTIELASPSQR